MTTATSSERAAGVSPRAALVPPAPETPAAADLLGLSCDGFPDRDSWEQLGRYLARATSSHHWLLGDWVLAGERQWTDTAEALADLTGLDPQTIRGARYVCQRFERVRRRTSLTFAHHREVASLDPAEADRLLDRAEAESLSRAALRALVASLRSVTAAPTAPSRSEIASGLLTAAVEERARLAVLPGADRARVAHERYIDELEILVEHLARLSAEIPAEPAVASVAPSAAERPTLADLRARLAAASPHVAADQPATAEDLKGGRYGRRV